jgi:carbamoyltransferase
MPAHVLGISAFFHDSAAALLRDGEIVAAAQEERFTRRKQDPGYPRRAIEYCLGEAGIGVSDLQHVAFFEDPLTKFDRLLETQLAVAPSGLDAFRDAMPAWTARKLDLEAHIRGELGAGFQGELHSTEHHQSHAASAFFPSPFQEAAILTLDAVGEWATSSIGTGRGNRIALSHEMRFPHSLGMLYSAFTYYTGFKVNSGEYKLMGLAPYGRPRYAELILDEVVTVRDDGSIWLDMTYFEYCHGSRMTSEKFHQLFGGPPRRPEDLITQKEMDLAASIQQVCDEVVLRAARHAHGLTGLDNLVMAGGVALNCVANGVVLREGPFERVWVQPAAGDAGGALGAAYMVWHHVLDADRPHRSTDAQQGSLLGPRYDEDDTAAILDSLGARYEKPESEDVLLDRVAGLLDAGKVVGWFQGRMEYGPRALGSRSIIGDARNAEMQKTMNLKIKFRESFRPFAPCVLAEHAREVFEIPGDDDSPYMLFVAPVREDWRLPLGDEERARLQDPDLRVRLSVPRSRLPAITHVDDSARIQTVDARRHGRYHRLMCRFHERTGCPVIVNTSFNIRGEPIVCTPREAFECFMATDMDCLVVDDFVMLKEMQPAWLSVDAEEHRSRFELD